MAEVVSQLLLQKLALRRRDRASSEHQEAVAEALYAWRASVVKAMAELADSRADADLDRLGDLQADLLRIGLIFTAFNSDPDLIGIQQMGND